MTLRSAIVVLLAVPFFTASMAHAREIRIVGSSTIFPFSAAAAEQFGRSTEFKTPVVESTGSGGGLKLFCSGVGLQHPDIANAPCDGLSQISFEDLDRLLAEVRAIENALRATRP